MLAGLFEFEVLPVPVGVCELDGTIVAINTKGVQLLSRPLRDLVGKKAWDIAPGADHIWPDIVRATEHGEAKGEITVATPTGPLAIHYIIVQRTHIDRQVLVLFGVARSE